MLFILLFCGGFNVLEYTFLNENLNVNPLSQEPLVLEKPL